MHVPHWIRLPQPSPAGPHVNPCCAQLRELHVAWYGVTHEETSKSMNSTTASCGVIGLLSHSAGNVIPWL